MGVEHDERVSSCELQWSGLSDWAVLADAKQRVEHSGLQGGTDLQGEQRIVARFAPRVLAQFGRDRARGRLLEGFGMPVFS